MKVIKFGGSSLADAKQIKKVCSIVQSDRQRRIVVVSAPGKRDGNDTKVTDLLINLAVTCRDNGNKEAALEAVVERYASIAKDLHLGKEIVKVIKDDLLERMAKYSDNYGMFEDLLKAAGEDNSAKLVACYLQSIGENAEYIDPKEAGMILSNEFGNAQVLPHSYELLAKLAERDTIMIFPGFSGIYCSRNSLMRIFPIKQMPWLSLRLALGRSASAAICRSSGFNKCPTGKRARLACSCLSNARK